MKKSSNNNEFNSFIDDCIWMSYRYCIGRHTIASHMHAADIANYIIKNNDVISEDRKKFYAEDIRRTIEEQLHYSPFNFRYNYSVSVSERRPLEALINFLINNNSLDKIKNITGIEVYKDAVSKEIKYDVSYSESDKNKDRFTYYDITDLITWMNLSSYLDKDSWKTCKVKTDTGEIKEIAYFDSYSQINGNSLEFKKEKVPIVCYENSPYLTGYLIEENIVSE